MSSSFFFSISGHGDNPGSLFFLLLLSFAFFFPLDVGGILFFFLFFLANKYMGLPFLFTEPMQ